MTPGPAGREVADHWAAREVVDARIDGAKPVRLPGGRVTLLRVEPGEYVHYDGREYLGLPNRSRYAVEVDGVIRGHVAYPAGVGGRWRAWTLGNVSRRHTHRDVVRRKDLSDPDSSRDGRDGLALRFAGWAEAGLAPTASEVRAVHEGMATEDDAEAASWAATKAAYDAHDAERRVAETARRESEWREARQRRVRAREALQSIREGLRTSLSNAELAGVEDALAELAGEPARPQGL